MKRHWIGGLVAGLLMLGVAQAGMAQELNLLRVCAGPDLSTSDPTLPAPALAAPPAQPQVLTGDCGLGCCGCCCPKGKLIAGAGLYIMQPYFSNNPAYNVFVQGTGPGQRTDVTSHMNAAPLVWLGYLGENGWGVRGRWWYFRQDTSQTLSFPPGQGDFTVFSASALGAQLIVDNPSLFSVTSKLQLQVADFEAIKAATFGDWNVLVSGGLRYANLSQNFNAYSLPADQGPLISGSNLTAVGPVVALELRYPVCSAFNFYGGFRSSLLYGRYTQNATGIRTEFDPTSETAEGGNVTGADHHTPVLAVEELELGVEANYYWGRNRLFGQLALIGQEWFGAGNASGSMMVAPPTGATVFAGNSFSNLGFFGLSVRLGINF